jgi:hypothetical protein
MVLLRIVGLGLLLALAILPAHAQDANETCPALVEQALASIGNACSGAARNSACYGFDRVNATFFEAQPDNVFAQPGDLAELALVQAIRTAGLDIENNIWGLAMLQLQANIPAALPGQALTFLLMGDVEIENAVPQGNPVVIVPVTATTNANIRSGPGTNFNVLGSTSSGQTFDADGLSADGQWVRIAFNGQAGWINITLVTGDTSALNVAEEGASLTPMQAIYLRTGLSTIECDNVPASSLVVQGPRGLTVNFTVNGAEVEIGSTVVFQTREDENATGKMEIAVLDGHAIADGVFIPTGHTAEVELDEEGLVIEETWTEAEPMTEEELAAYAPFAELDGLPLAYTIELPTPEEIEQAAEPDEDDFAGGDLPFPFFGDYQALMALMARYGLSPEEMESLSPEELQSRMMAMANDPEFQAIVAALEGEMDDSEFDDTGEDDFSFPEDDGSFDDGGDNG